MEKVILISKGKNGKHIESEITKLIGDADGFYITSANNYSVEMMIDNKQYVDSLLKNLYRTDLEATGTSSVGNEIVIIIRGSSSIKIDSNKTGNRLKNFLG